MPTGPDAAWLRLNHRWVSCSPVGTGNAGGGIYHLSWCHKATHRPVAGDMASSPCFPMKRKFNAPRRSVDRCKVVELVAANLTSSDGNEMMLDSCCPYISISRGRGSPPRVASARWKNKHSFSHIGHLTLRQGVLIQNQSSEFFYVISIQSGQSNMQAIRWNRVDLWDNAFFGSSSKT